MTFGEAQANTNIVSGIIFVFGTPARVFFDSESSKSFVSSAFALHAD